MKKTARILIVDDESPIREVLSATLKDGRVRFDRVVVEQFHS